VAEKAFGNKSGARDLRRVIRKEVEDVLCSALIDDPDRPLKAVTVGAEDGKIKLTYVL
jgi:ATP-dependent Clp protease ATP-binding subunit ClpA